MRSNYEVIVGNIGEVFYGNSYSRALECFNNYVDISLNSGWRAREYGESVKLMCNGNILKEYSGHLYPSENYDRTDYSYLAGN